MYTSSLDFWYNKDRTYSFSLICNCGATINGVILNGSKSDKLHCDCGLVWEVNKPYVEEE